MSYLILAIVMFSILIGSLSGGLFVTMICLFRRDQAIDSLIRPEDLVGMAATVELPFDADSKGKIQVKLNNSILYLPALTTELTQLRKGEKVMILQVENNIFWVVKDGFG